MSVIRGRAILWDRPRQAGGVWESTLTLEGGVTLFVSTQCAEDHVWITCAGQRVVAEDIVWQDAWNARTSRVFLGEEEEEGEEEDAYRVRLFGNLLRQKVTGVQVDGLTLLVFLERSGCVKCVDRARFPYFQVGDTVSLFNLTMGSSLYFTERSGIHQHDAGRRVAKKRPLSPPPPPRHRVKWHKWHCLMCGWLNYPSHGSCRSCERTRRAGPESLFDFYRHSFQPLWQCRCCGHEEWNTWDATCWNCGKSRHNNNKKGKQQ